MSIHFYEKKVMKRAIEIGEQCKIFEGKQYTAYSKTLDIVFHINEGEAEKTFLQALKDHNNSGKDPIYYCVEPIHNQADTQPNSITVPHEIE